MASALSLFSRYVRVDVPECPELMIDDAILQAGIEFCERATLIKEKLTITTVIGQPDYALAVSAGMLPDEILRVARDQVYFLDPSSESEFIASGYDNLNGMPTHYYLDGSKLILGRVPDSIEDLEVTVKVRPSASSTTLPDELYNRYSIEIAAGAKAMLMLMPNKPWSDPQSAAFNQNIFDVAIDKEILRHAKGGSRTPLRTTLYTF